MLHGLLIDPQQESFIQRLQQDQQPPAAPSTALEAPAIQDTPASAVPSMEPIGQQNAAQGWHHGYQVWQSCPRADCQASVIVSAWKASLKGHPVFSFHAACPANSQLAAIVIALPGCNRYHALWQWQAMHTLLQALCGPALSSTFSRALIKRAASEGQLQWPPSLPSCRIIEFLLPGQPFLQSLCRASAVFRPLNSHVQECWALSQAACIMSVHTVLLTQTGNCGLVRVWCGLDHLPVEASNGFWNL